jgi:hypothetical protein
MTNWVFIYCYYISIESFWKGESNEHMQNFIGTYTYLFKGIKVLMIPSPSPAPSNICLLLDILNGRHKCISSIYVSAKIW